MVDLTNNEETPQYDLYSERRKKLLEALNEAKETLETAKKELSAAELNGDAERIKLLQLNVDIAAAQVNEVQDNLIMLDQAYDDGVAMGVVRPDPITETTKDELTQEKTNLQSEKVSISDKVFELQKETQKLGSPKNLEQNAKLLELQTKQDAYRVYLTQIENRIEEINYLLQDKNPGTYKREEVAKAKLNANPMDYTWDLEFEYPGQLTEEQIIKQFEDFKLTDKVPIEDRRQLTFKGNVTPERKAIVQNFFDDLSLMFQDSIANRLTDTVTFNGMVHGPTMDFTLWHDKFIYINKLAISPTAQNQKAGSLMAMHTAKFAMENGYYILTFPATDWLRDTYKKYGGKELGGGDLVIVGDIKQFEKDWLNFFYQDGLNRPLDKPAFTYLEEYNRLKQLYRGLTPEQKTLYKNITNEFQLDNFTTEITNSLINDTGIDNINWQTAGAQTKPFGSGIYEDMMIFSKAIDAAQGTFPVESVVDLANQKYFENLIRPFMDTNAGMFGNNIMSWMLTSDTGSEFLSEILIELEANNVDTSSEKYNNPKLLREVIERRLNLKGILNDTLSLNEVTNLLKTTGRIFLPYDQLEPDGPWNISSHLWDFKLSDSDIEIIKEFYKPEYRENILNALFKGQDRTEIIDLIGDYKTSQDAANNINQNVIKRNFTNKIKGKLESMDVLRSQWVVADVHPTLDIGMNQLYVYHAGHPINAALGLREPDWDNPYGSRTAGHGSNTYFATSANYTSDYRGFGGANYSGRPTYAYQIDLTASGIANENILGYERPMTTQFIDKLLTNMEAGMRTSEWNAIYPIIENWLDVPGRNRSYFQLKWFLQHQHNFKRPVSWWIDVLKKSDIKVIYHPHTGRGGGPFGNQMLTPDGPMTLDTGWSANGRLEEELLFLSPEELEYYIYEMPDTWGNTTRRDSVIDVNTLKEFKPETAVQDLVANYFNRLGDTVINDYKGHAYFLEDILREMKIEFENRPNFNPELKKKLLTEMESVVAQVRNLIDVEGATGKDILRAIDFNKLSNEVGGNFITYKINTGDLHDMGGINVDADELLYRYEINENNVRVKKLYLIQQNNINDKSFILIDQDGNELVAPYSRDFIYDSDLNYTNSSNKILRKDNITQNIKNAYEFQKQFGDEIIKDTTKPIINWQSEEQLLRTLRSPFTNDRLIIPVYYRNNAGVPLNIDEIRAGYARHFKPIATAQGDVQYIQLDGDLFTPNNTGGSITFALDDQALKNDMTFYEMTGEKVNPLATDNYFEIEINSKNIVDINTLKTSEWLASFDIKQAAEAFNIPSYRLIEYLELAGLAERTPENVWRIKGTPILDMSDIYNAKTIKLAELLNPNLEPEFVISKLLRAGGIEGYISQPFLSLNNLTEGERTTSFITLFDPNDQSGIGRHVPIKPLEEPSFGQYKIVTPGEDIPPLTNYEDLRFINDQSVINEAFENRTLFNKGFNAVEKQALGLTGDIPDLVNESIFDKKTVQRILDVGQYIDDVTSINNATDMVISQFEQATKLTEQEALNTLRAAVETGNYLELEYLTRTGRAKGLLNKKIAQSIQYRGKLGAGLAFLDYFEIATLTAAATYGSRSVWAKELSNEVYTLTKGLLGNEYDVENLELDWEEYISALQTAEKVSPFSWLFKKVIDRPLFKTIGEYDWKVQYGDEGFKPKTYNPDAPYSVPQVLMSSVLAGVTPGVVMDDLLPEKPSYTMGDLAAVTNYMMPTDPAQQPTIRQSTPEEQQYLTAGPWGRFWMDFKDNYADFKRKQLEDKKNPWWLGEHTVSVSNSENESSSIYDKYKTPEKKWYDIGRNW